MQATSDLMRASLPRSALDATQDYEYLPATSETIIYVTMIGLMIRRLAQE